MDWIDKWVEENINWELTQEDYSIDENFLEQLVEWSEEPSNSKELPVEEDLLMDKEFRFGTKKKRKKTFGMKGSSTIKLDKETARIMGQANSAFVQQDHQKAIELFLEVIRKSPCTHEPYNTLGLIYEEIGDMSKALGYFLISAQLQKTDATLWRKIADESK